MLDTRNNSQQWKEKKKTPKSGYFAYPMYKTVHLLWFIHKNHIHKIKSRYGFSMKPIYLSTTAVTCMFLYLIANIKSTKQNMSNLLSPSHIACSQRLHRSLSLGKVLWYCGKHVSWMFSLKQSPTALKLSLGFKIHNPLRKIICLFSLVCIFNRTRSTVTFLCQFTPSLRNRIWKF